MKVIATWMFCLFMGVTVMAQNQFMSAKDSDPQAKKLLQSLRSDYEGYNSLQVDFELVINLPEQEQEVQKGKMIQKGSQYFVDMPSQAIYNNGENLWLYLKNNQEVQLNNADSEEGAMMSPRDLLASFDNGDYVYAITDERKIDGEAQTVIDFKPLDDMSEYSKMTVFLGAGGKELRKISILAKDGSRFTLSIIGLKPNIKISDSIFSFDESAYPDVIIEDLRID